MLESALAEARSLKLVGRAVIIARDSIYAIARICYRPSVRLSVRHTGGSVNKKAELSQRWPRDARPMYGMGAL